MSSQRGPIAGALVIGGNYGSLAVLRSLGRLGLPVAFLGDRFSAASSSRYLSHYETWSGVAEPDPLGRIMRFVERQGLNNYVLFPGADFEVQLVSQHRAELETRLKLLTMDWDTLAALNDKGRLHDMARRAGIDLPQEWPADVSPEALVYPVVIKPASTQAVNALTRDKAWRADTGADFALKQALARQLMGAGGFVVQQLIPGDGTRQYSYAGLWDRGQELFHLTALRLRQFPVQFGTSPYVESHELPRAADSARQLLREANYHGLVEVEFKHDVRDDRLKLLDVNTRVWAWIGLGEACGVDFPLLAAQLATGLEPQGAVPHYGAAWRRAIPNMLASLQGLVKEGRPGLDAVRSILGPAHPAVFATDDLVPALGEIPLQLLRKLKGLRSQ